MNKISKKMQDGFTLVEILVVVIIIGILAAIAIPTYMRYVQRGYASDAKVTIQAILQASEVYEQETGSWPTAIDILEEEGYLEVSLATKRKWQFELSDLEITATSLAEMKGGEGQILTYYIEDGEYKGYGQKEE